jgi:hypothetical protein
MARLLALLVGFFLAFPLASQNPCAKCHPKEVEGYERSGMSRSIGRPVRQAGGLVTHEASGARFAIESGDNRMRHRMSRNGRTEEHAVSYFVGSGHTGRSYLVSRQDYLFQSPVSHYTKRDAWDMSPGYAEDRNADFSRPVAAECLQCHAGRALPVEGTLNRYQEPPFAEEAISCDRCHGPSEAHLAKPVRQTIVNPKNLSMRARDSVCEQCHLAGEVRVPNPGRGLADFRPGMELEDVWSVYVLEQPGAPADAMKAVSHAESLALSVCAKSSADAMWCGSCHNPHETPASPSRYYRERCLACHGEALLETHASPSGDCVGCHMPKQGTADVAHAAVTEHRILRNPRNQPVGAARQRLTSWREPVAGLRKRNFGLALIEVGERYRYDLLMQQGLRLLNELRESATSDPAVARDTGGMRDAAVIAAIGKALYGQRKFADAAAMFEAAAEIEPRAAEHPLHLGSVYRELGNSDKAIEYFERAIQLDPGRQDAYQGLATLFRETDRPEQARAAMLRYEEFLNGR